MINTKKGWNLKVKNYIDLIKHLDEDLYNVMATQIYEKIDDTNYKLYKVKS